MGPRGFAGASWAFALAGQFRSRLQSTIREKAIRVSMVLV
jgi:hypothetical protein